MTLALAAIAMIAKVLALFLLPWAAAVVAVLLEWMQAWVQSPHAVIRNGKTIDLWPYKETEHHDL